MNASLWISLVALVVSVTGLGFTLYSTDIKLRSRMERAKQQSSAILYRDVERLLECSGALLQQHKAEEHALEAAKESVALVDALLQAKECFDEFPDIPPLVGWFVLPRLDAILESLLQEHKVIDEICANIHAGRWLRSAQQMRAARERILGQGQWRPSGR